VIAYADKRNNSFEFILRHLTGGIDIAAEWAGFTTVGQCDLETIETKTGKLVPNYAFKVLEKRFPNVPRFTDVKKLNARSFYEQTGLRTVDVLSGGYPCQPFSLAGKRGGEGDNRLLWTEMFRIIQELRPTWVLGENVVGHISLGLDATLSDLESIGYAARTFIIPACAVEAPHERSRVFIVAYDTSRGAWRGERGEERGVPQGQNAERARVRENVPHSDSERQQQPQRDKQESGRRIGDVCQKERVLFNAASVGRTTGGMERVFGEPQQALGETPARQSIGASCEYGLSDGGQWWATEPDLGRVANGISNRVDRLKCLGNAVVPQQAYPILKAIALIIRGEE
jgi:DNA (cytosine-5)-methyltransferase 1